MGAVCQGVGVSCQDRSHSRGYQDTAQFVLDLGHWEELVWVLCLPDPLFRFTLKGSLVGNAAVGSLVLL